jgi:myosin-1
MCTIGWWLAKTATGEGWAPSAYLKEEAPPAPVIRPTPPPPPAAAPRVNGANGANGPVARAKPAPPAPPAKRPAAGRKPAPPPAPRDSGLSMNGSVGSGTDSGRNTPTPSLAGGLAEALRARQNAMQKGREDEDDW